jgi:hypothetical protein
MLRHAVTAAVLGSRHETGNRGGRGPQDHNCQQHECASPAPLHDLFSHRFSIMIDRDAQFDSDPGHMVFLERCRFPRYGRIRQT